MKSTLLLVVALMMLVHESVAQILEFPQKSISVSMGAVISQNNYIKPAKLFNRINTEAKIQLILCPQSDSKNYIFKFSGENYSLLYQGIMQADSVYYFPSVNAMMSFDGNNNEEHISIIVTSKDYYPLDQAIKNKTDLAYLIDSLLDKEQIVDDAPRILNIGGNLRDIKNVDNILKKYTGTDCVSREYNFEVRK